MDDKHFKPINQENFIFTNRFVLISCRVDQLLDQKVRIYFNVQLNSNDKRQLDSQSNVLFGIRKEIKLILAKDAFHFAE